MWVVWYDFFSSVHVYELGLGNLSVVQFLSMYTCLQRGELEFVLFLLVLFGGFIIALYHTVKTTGLFSSSTLHGIAYSSGAVPSAL